MRKLRCIEIPGLNAEEVLDEFNELKSKRSIVDESQIVSVSVLPATDERRIQVDGEVRLANVCVVVVYWSED